MDPAMNSASTDDVLVVLEEAVGDAALERILSELSALGYVHTFASKLTNTLFGQKMGTLDPLKEVEGVARVTRGGMKRSAL